MRLLIIPAAGRGSRLGASTPKPLVEIDGRPMLDHLADLYRPFVERIVVIAHPSFSNRIAAWAERHEGASVVEQAAPTGMLDAILLAAPEVRAAQPEAVWITWSDQVGVLPATVQRLADLSAGAPPPDLLLPTVTSADPYTHFERDPSGRIIRMLQRREGDSMPELGEGDIGLFAMPRATFEQDLQVYARDVPVGTETGERNFVPFVAWLAQRKAVATFPCTDPMEAIGVNTPEQLARVSAWLRSRSRPS